MKAKTYQIDSFKSLCNAATPENVENLAEDLGMWLKSYVAAIQAVRDHFPKESDGKTNWEVSQSGFTWHDDGKHDIKGIKMTAPGIEVDMKFTETKKP